MGISRGMGTRRWALVHSRIKAEGYGICGRYSECPCYDTKRDALRSVLYHATAPEFYRYRENVSGQYIWVTTEVLPCRGCCAQSPWATVGMRKDPQADQLSEELDFSYSHDTLTGLANRSRYEADLRELPHSGYESVVCTYIDVVGMHEVNEHLGHRSGDTLLCCLANAARKFFATSRVYRIGSDEFVILTPNEPPYSVWSTADRMRAFLKEILLKHNNAQHALNSAPTRLERSDTPRSYAVSSRGGKRRREPQRGRGPG